MGGLSEERRSLVEGSVVRRDSAGGSAADGKWSGWWVEWRCYDGLERDSGVSVRCEGELVHSRQLPPREGGGAEGWCGMVTGVFFNEGTSLRLGSFFAEKLSEAALNGSAAGRGASTAQGRRRRIAGAIERLHQERQVLQQQQQERGMQERQLRRRVAAERSAEGPTAGADVAVAGGKEDTEGPAAAASAEPITHASARRRRRFSDVAPHYKMIRVVTDGERREPRVRLLAFGAGKLRLRRGLLGWCCNRRVCVGLEEKGGAGTVIPKTGGTVTVSSVHTH